MAKKGGNPQNLISLKDRPTDEQRKIAKKGAQRSIEVRREKKLMRELYAEFLAKKYEVTIDKTKKTITGSDLCLEMLPKIVQKADASSVSFFKELDRVQMEDLERNRVTDNELKIIIDDEGSDASKDE